MTICQRILEAWISVNLVLLNEVCLATQSGTPLFPDPFMSYHLTLQSTHNSRFLRRCSCSMLHQELDARNSRDRVCDDHESTQNAGLSRDTNFTGTLRFFSQVNDITRTRLIIDSVPPNNRHPGFGALVRLGFGDDIGRQVELAWVTLLSFACLLARGIMRRSKVGGVDLKK